MKKESSGKVTFQPPGLILALTRRAFPLGLVQKGSSLEEREMAQLNLLGGFLQCTLSLKTGLSGQ